MPGEVLFLCLNENQARILYAVGKELGDLPHRFGSLDPFTASPHYGCTAVLTALGAAVEQVPVRDPTQGRPLLLRPLLYPTLVRRAFRDYLERTRPGVVVIGNDSVSCTVQVIRAARQVGVPTLLVQDGLILAPPPLMVPQTPRRIASRLVYGLPNRLGMDFGTGAPYYYGRRGCTKMALMSHATAEWLVNDFGVPPASIAVTGYVDYDRLARPRPLVAADLPPAVRELETPYALYAHQHMGLGLDLELEHIRRMKEAIEQLGHALVVKLHPREEDPGVYTRAVPDLVVAHREPIWPLIQGARALLTCSSTVGLEALFLPIPVGTLDFVPSPDHLDLGAASIKLESLDTLSERMTTLLADDVARRAMTRAAPAVLREYVTYTDGRAAARVADVVRGMLAHQAVSGGVEHE